MAVDVVCRGLRCCGSVRNLRVSLRFAGISGETHNINADQVVGEGERWFKCRAVERVISGLRQGGSRRRGSTQLRYSIRFLKKLCGEAHRLARDFAEPLASYLDVAGVETLGCASGLDGGGSRCNCNLFSHQFSETLRLRTALAVAA